MEFNFVRKIRRYGIPLIVLLALPVRSEVPAEKEKLITQYLTTIHVFERIDAAVENTPQAIRTKIKPGRLYNGYDISTDVFWQALLPEYEKKKAQTREALVKEFYDFFARKYSEQELREMVNVVTSPAWVRIMAGGQDPENPGVTYEKKLRGDVYGLIRERVEKLKNDVPETQLAQKPVKDGRGISSLPEPADVGADGVLEPLLELEAEQEPPK